MSEGFLSRWSRRKRGEIRDEPEAAPAAPPPAEAAAVPEPEFDPASLPPVESLRLDSDLSAFLRTNVPAVLKNAALRRVWSLDPTIRDFTGPAEYAWDFNAPDGVPGFAAELGGNLRKLLAQATGIPDPEDEPGEEPALAAGEAGAAAEESGDLLAAGDGAEAGREAEPVASSLRLSAAPSPERPANTAQSSEDATEVVAEVLPVSRRRHGGAVPC